MSSKRRNSEQVKLARNFSVPPSFNDEVIRSFLSDLDCPRSLTVWLLYESNEARQLVDLDISPSDFVNPQCFRDAYTATNFLSKSNFLKLDVSKEDVALEKFFKFEELCKATNSRFRNLNVDPLYKGSNVWLLNATIRKIDQILGEFCPDEWVESANWGPGVTTLLKGSHVSASNKFQSETGITRDLYSLLSDGIFAAAYPIWFDHLTQNSSEWLPNYVVGNSIITVPKNSKTDRVIAIEPGLNLWFQKGLGAMIRRRLSRQGINLNSQIRNQQLARRASIDDSLATIDFSSASDSISKLVVQALLPERWFKIANITRSSFGVQPDSNIHWQKFSSMGNGFTFELESLIFFAAAAAVCEYDGSDVSEISVFGDDVIIPAASAELFSAFSEFLGFKVNTQKSFSSGNFRESCGAHYFAGVNCKPIFLKEKLRNVQSLYKLANSVRNLAHRHNSYYGCDSRFRSTWYHLFRRVPKPLRFYCPSGLGDSGFAVNFDEACPARSRNGWEGYSIPLLLELGRKQPFEGEGLLLANLKGIVNIDEQKIVRRDYRLCTTFNSNFNYIREGYRLQSDLKTRSEGSNYSLRGQVETKVGIVQVHQWYNLGPWS